MVAESSHEFFFQAWSRMKLVLLKFVVPGAFLFSFFFSCMAACLLFFTFIYFIFTILYIMVCLCYILALATAKEWVFYFLLF